ncbi:MAG: hypothetical protein IJP86_05725 [Synergistaceae bacterium]|nr:hypothetical protein [Synergistaceae bacterium]
MTEVLGVEPLCSYMGRNDITAYQASKRGGWLCCEKAGNRVIISRKAALFSEGEIFAGQY